MQLDHFRALLEHLDAMRAGFATSMRVPTEARNNFILATNAEPDSVAVLVGGDLEVRPCEGLIVVVLQCDGFGGCDSGSRGGSDVAGATM